MNKLLIIPVASPEYPNVKEAFKAREEVDIMEKQDLDLFLSRPVKHVLFELECRSNSRNGCDLLTVAEIFNYGYILGKRAERAKRKQKSKAKKVR
jgi:hypothetical protein